MRYFREIKKKGVVFLISDLMDHGFDSALKLTSKRHELSAIQIIDD